MKPGERAVIVAGEWHLIKMRDPFNPWGWFFDDKFSRATGRADGLIYRAGFASKPRAIGWAIKEGILPEGYEENESAAAAS